MGSFLGPLGIVDGLELLNLPFGVVGDDKLHGVHDSRDARGTLVEVVAHGTLEERKVVERVVGRIANLVDKVDDTLGRVATATESTDGGHAGIVPSAYEAVLDQRQQVALRHQRVVEVELVELGLPRTVVLDIVGLAAPLFHPSYKEIIQGPVLHELKRAPRVGDAFEVVALPMGEVIHGIGVPLRTSAPMRYVKHTVDERVAEEHIRVSHINLGAQHQCSGLALAAVHEFKQAQVLLDGTVAEGAVGARRRRGALLLGNDLGALFVDIGTPLLDKPYGEVPQLLEVV